MGEQIKYYRTLYDIKQTDLGLKLNFDRSTIRSLENNQIKLINVDLIKSVIDELGIKDKIKITDEYIKFMLDNPSEKILKARKKRKLSRKDFANLVGVSDTSIKRWENGSLYICREKYEKLKKYL